uniref:Uncharacterized protein n=1 Tax=Rhizophora mucronata TaxID=61149 RepID=A0A2P2IIA8_RHIMU
MDLFTNTQSLHSSTRGKYASQRELGRGHFIPHHL